jgi:hypothetical protein
MFVDNTLLMDASLCDDANRNRALGENTQAQCQSRRGGPVNISALGNGFIIGTKADISVDQNWINIMERAGVTEDEAYGTVGRTDLHLPNEIRLEKYPVAVINRGQDHNAAHLPLGPNSTFLRALGALGMSPALGFGLNIGSQSITGPRAGNLVIAGTDIASIRGAWHNYTINHNTPDPGDRICPLQVVVEEVRVKFPNGSDSENLLGTGPGRSTPAACIEP